MRIATWPFLVLLICGTAGLSSIALGIDNYWDLRFYHLYAPWAYLHDRYMYDIAPAQSQGFLNPTADFFFYSLISSRLNNFPRAIAFIMGAVHGINAVLVLAISFQVFHPIQRIDRQTLATLALLMGVSGAGFISLLGGTSNDLLNSIFVLASLLALLKIFNRVGDHRIWVGFAWSGLLAGVAVGLKYTAAIFIPGLGLIALITAMRHKTLGGLLAFGIAAMLGLLVVAGHHLLTLWQDFGNPVFPLLNHIFQSPYYEVESIRDKQFLPRDFWQAIAYPFYWAKTNRYLVTEIPFRDWRGAIAYVAIIFGFLAFVKRRACENNAQNAETRGLGLVFIFVTVSFFSWEFSFGNYRYGIVLELLTGVVTMGAVILLFTDRRVRIAVAITLLTIAGMTTAYLNWGRLPYGDRYIDIRVPPLPTNSLVLLATWNPSSYFIPFAEPTAQYLGIENNLLKLSQNNRLASEVKRLMKTSGRPKFVLNVGEFKAKDLNVFLGRFGLTLSTLPCQSIHANIAVEALRLCSVVDR